MGTIVEDVRGAAESVADVAGEASYLLDFSARSLWEVERLLDENSFDGQPRPGSLLAKDLGRRVFALGAYVGEVIRGCVGGEWVTDAVRGDWVADDAVDTDVSATLVTLKLPSGELLWPNQRIMKRIMVGPPESVVAYAVAAGVDPGDGPLTH